MKLNPNWTWFFKAPLDTAWRGRLELCLGVVASAAAVVALSSSIQPDPAKLALARHGKSTELVSSAPPTPPSPSDPVLTGEFVRAVQSGDVRSMAKAYVPGMPLSGMLLSAARSGKKEAVSWLLRHGADVHDEEDSVYSPMLAADEYPEIVALLRAQGAKEPTLEYAAIANAPNALFRLLESHPNLNARDSYPLQQAAASPSGTKANKWKVVRRLVTDGADPNRDYNGSNALAGILVDCNYVEPSQCMPLVQLLLDHGARVTGAALAAALSLGDDVRSAPLDALLERPMDKGVTSTALANATSLNADDVKRVVKKGVDWAYHDGEEDEALPVLSAVRRADRDSVRVLLDAGAPVDAHFKDSSCALAEAIDGSAHDTTQARIVELLVTRGANVNRRFPDGRTPLFAAAEAGDLRVVNFLIARGARVNDLVLDDMPLDIADQNGHLPAARVLHAHGAKRNRPQYPMYR